MGVCTSRELNAGEHDELEKLRKEKDIWDTGKSAAPVSAAVSVSARDAKRQPSPRTFTKGDGCPEFLNQMLKFLWPHISTFVNTTIMETVQPLIKDALPGPLKAAFRFDANECNLGKEPMQFPVMFVEKNSQRSATGDLEVLTLKAGIEWRSDMSVRMFLTGAPIGVEKLIVVGDLYFEFVNLIDKPPFFDGVRLFFSTMPEVSIDFRGVLRGFNMDAIKRIIVDVIKNGIEGALVLPNRKGFALVPEADIFRITCPRPQGSLKLVIHKASKLIAADSAGLFSKASSDPFVQVHLGPEMRHSASLPKNLNPVFEFAAIFPIASMDTQNLKVALMDDDSGMQRITSGEDDFLGGITVNVEDAIRWGTGSQKTFQLQDEKGNEGKNGDITVSAEWRPMVLKKVEGEDSGYVFAGIYNGSELSGDSEGMTYWVVASFNDGIRTKPATKESPKIAPPVPPAPDSKVQAAEASALQKKIGILKKHKLSLEDMAEVLEKEPAVIDPSVKSKEDAQEYARHTVSFNHPFEFTTEAVSKSELVLELKGKSEKGKEKSYGTIKKAIVDLSKDDNLTIDEEYELDNGAILKVKMQLLYNDKPTSSL